MVPRHPPPPYELLRDSSTHSKAASFPESSHSNEADDEQSVSESSSTMDSPSPPRAAYLGEDRRLTSTRELAGFYIYGWAAEVFVVCGVGSFIPITLEQLARERGVLLSDQTIPCTNTFNGPPPDANITSTDVPSGNNAQCVVYILGMEINTASFAMYTFSISVLLQALLIISMSGAADHGRFRKTFLLCFAFTGAIATMLFLPTGPRVYMLAALLAIIANTCFGASFVLLNSFLPLLVRHHPTVQFAEATTSSDDESYASDRDEEENEALVREAQLSNHLRDHETTVESIADSTTALIPDESEYPDLTIPNPVSASTPSARLALSTKISSYGIGIGYIAALLVQSLSIFLIILTSSTNFSLRLVLFVIGAWWFIFTIPAALWLRARPGPPLALPPHTRASTIRTARAYFTHSWHSLYRTILHARRLRDVILFLLAWLLISDAIATVSGTAVLFAKTSLAMKPAALALINVIATMAGITGAFTWSRLSILTGLHPAQTVLACIALFELVPLYGLLGYVPAVRRAGVFGLQQAWEMYPLAAVYGFVLGGLSSYCRSVFAELVPPGYEAAFFALYAITDKGSSVVGPAVVGVITDRAGEIRPAFWFLAVLVGAPAALVWWVDVERGRCEAGRLSWVLAAEAAEGRGKGKLGGRGRYGGLGGEERVEVNEEEEEGEQGEHGGRGDGEV